MARDSAFLLPTQGLRVRPPPHRRWLVLAIVLVLAIAGAYFGARPARDAIKAWQARRHAHRAFALIDKEQWSDARNEAVAALQLGRNEPQAMRAVARFLTRTRQPDALEFWTELAKVDNL